MLAIRIHETGGVEKLRADEVSLPVPADGEVRIRVEAAGVNFFDTYQRSGLYPVSLPHTLGQEVAGVITAIGSDVTEFSIGDRVATARANGGYASEAIAAASQVVRIPEGIATATAGALLLQGLTAHFLVNDTFALKPGNTALVHAAAGGVGLLLVQLAKRRGARVIATVGTKEKAQLAREAGADETVLYTREDVAAAARKFSSGRGVDVVYDSVGKDTFAGSLDSLKPRGLLVSFGNASGPVPPFAPLLLAQKGSLYLTRPTLAHYIQSPAELRGRTDELFAAVLGGELRVRIGATFALTGASDAHQALESRSTTGKILLLP